MAFLVSKPLWTIDAVYVWSSGPKESGYIVQVIYGVDKDRTIEQRLRWTSIKPFLRNGWQMLFGVPVESENNCTISMHLWTMLALYRKRGDTPALDSHTHTYYMCHCFCRNKKWWFSVGDWLWETMFWVPRGQTVPMWEEKTVSGRKRAPTKITDIQLYWKNDLCFKSPKDHFYKAKWPNKCQLVIPSEMENF